MSGEPSDKAPIEELNLSKAGISIKSFQMNTLLTLICSVFAGATALAIWFHMNETKEASTSFVNALKEQTTAIRDQTVVAREQNCLMRFDQKERLERAEFCRSVSR